MNPLGSYVLLVLAEIAANDVKGTMQEGNWICVHQGNLMGCAFRIIR